MSQKKYLKQTQPFVVPTTDGKLIEEHIGRAATQTTGFSVAHMIAPPHWTEPHQTPEFDEVTIVLRGRKLIEVDGEPIELTAGQTLLVKAGARVRYSNPYPEELEYWSVCVPAFDFTRVNREENA